MICILQGSFALHFLTYVTVLGFMFLLQMYSGYTRVLEFTVRGSGKFEKQDFIPMLYFKYT